MIGRYLIFGAVAGILAAVIAWLFNIDLAVTSTVAGILAATIATGAGTRIRA